MSTQQLVVPNRNAQDWAGRCLPYAQTFFGAPIRYDSAWESWQATQFKHGPDVPIPTDRPVLLWYSHFGTYFSYSRQQFEYGNWGHVTPYIYGEAIYSSPGEGYGRELFQSIAQVERRFNATYVGWSEDINGLRVSQPSDGGDDEMSVEDSNRLKNIEAILVGGGSDIDNPAWLAGSGSVMGRIQNIAGVLYAGGTSVSDPTYTGSPGTLYSLAKTPVHRTLDGAEQMIPQIQDNADTNTIVRTLLAQVGALSAAVATLSVFSGADPEEVRKAAKRGAEDAIKEIKLVPVIDIDK